MTLTQALVHAESFCRATMIVFAGCVLAAMIGYFVSDKEVDDE